MENQHRHIKGYRELSAEEIALMNRIKEEGVRMEALTNELRNTPGLDQRWISLGVTNLQQGLMALNRGVEQPTTF